ncbi:hypothetical protein ACQY0O_006025 [Thecaphora frezii]
MRARPFHFFLPPSCALTGACLLFGQVRLLASGFWCADGMRLAPVLHEVALPQRHVPSSAAYGPPAPSFSPFAPRPLAEGSRHRPSKLSYQVGARHGAARLGPPRREASEALWSSRERNDARQDGRWRGLQPADPSGAGRECSLVTIPPPSPNFRCIVGLKLHRPSVADAASG